MDDILTALNECYRHEIKMVARYINYAAQVSGQDRLHLAEFFRQSALDSMGHAEKIGMKLAARGKPQGRVEEDLGAVPATPTQMLEQAMEDELAATVLYEAAVAESKKDLGLREVLLHILKDEQASVDELKLLLK